MADGCHAKSGCKGTKKKQQTSRMGEENNCPRRFFFNRRKLFMIHLCFIHAHSCYAVGNKSICLRRDANGR